jgi:hypothetical protein
MLGFTEVEFMKTLTLNLHTKTLLKDMKEGRKEGGKGKGKRGKGKKILPSVRHLFFFKVKFKKKVGHHGRRPSIVCCLLNILNCEPGSNELLQNHIK